MRLVIAVFIAGFLISMKPPYETIDASDINKQEVQETVSERASDEQPQSEEKATEEDVKVEEPKPKPLSNRELGKKMAAEKGWTGDQWRCLDRLWEKESNWNHTVSNFQGSGAYGIPQSLPASKMRSHGEDYLTNPRTQIAWGLDYIASRYSTPCGAWNFWLSRKPINGRDMGHWY